MRPAVPRSANIPELDGVRGIAVLLVLVHHFVPPPGVPKIVQAAAYLGWTGVDLFFVLSGFLITGILVDSKESPSYFSSFYVRRALRIFPLYLLSLFLYFHVALPLLGIPANQLEPWFWTYLSNWKSAFGEDIPVLSHFWSLAIEEQFYLVWPLVVFLTPLRILPWVLLGLAGASAESRLILENHAFSANFLCRLTPFRLEPLALGALVACIVRNPRLLSRLAKALPVLSACALTLFAAVLAVGRTGRPFHAPLATFGLSALGLSCACLVFTAGTSRIRFLRIRLLQVFGKYSYAIYVLHVPFAYFYNPAVQRASALLPPKVRVFFWMGTTAVAIAIVLALALVSWFLIEIRFLRLKDRFAPRPERAGPMVASLSTVYRMR